MIGKIFNRWTVVERGEDYIYPSSGKISIRYICQCVCGKVKLVHKPHLLNRTSQSCGCLNREISSTVGGLSKTKAYKAWRNMLIRCDDPKDNEQTYAERNIKYQQTWSDFLEFYEDMGECPEGHELERIDIFGDYCKDNCIWADEIAQATNRARFKNNTSGYTGVTWSEQHNKWRVGISVNKIRHEGGLFENIEDAILARKQLELKYLGYTKKHS